MTNRDSLPEMLRELAQRIFNMNEILDGFYEDDVHVLMRAAHIVDRCEKQHGSEGQT